jgi:hypothetical protein
METNLQRYLGHTRRVIPNVTFILEIKTMKTAKAKTETHTLLHSLADVQNSICVCFLRGGAWVLGLCNWVAVKRGGGWGRNYMMPC